MKPALWIAIGASVAVASFFACSSSSDSDSAHEADAGADATTGAPDVISTAPGDASPSDGGVDAGPLGSLRWILDIDTGDAGTGLLNASFMSGAPDGSVFIGGYMNNTVTIGGQTLSTTASNGGAFIMKVTANGAVAWAKAVTGGFATSAGGLAVDAAGDVIVTLTCDDTCTIDTDTGKNTIVAKLQGSDGKAVWVTPIQATNPAFPDDTQLTTLNGVAASGDTIALAGRTSGTLTVPASDGGVNTLTVSEDDNVDDFVVTLDSAGHLTAGVLFTGLGIEPDFRQGINSLSFDPTGNIVAIATLSRPSFTGAGINLNQVIAPPPPAADQSDALIMKLAPDLSVARWSVFLPSSGSYQLELDSIGADSAGITHVAGTVQGSVPVAGTTMAGASHTSPFVLDLGADGGATGSTVLTGIVDDPNSSSADSVGLDPNGDAVFFGNYHGLTLNGTLLPMAQTNEVGEYAWLRAGGQVTAAGYVVDPPDGGPASVYFGPGAITSTQVVFSGYLSGFVTFGGTVIARPNGYFIAALAR